MLHIERPQLHKYIMVPGKGLFRFCVLCSRCSIIALHVREGPQNRLNLETNTISKMLLCSFAQGKEQDQRAGYKIQVQMFVPLSGTLRFSNWFTFGIYILLLGIHQI